jgi:hypothetical protein
VAQVFLSYCHEDLPRVSPLVAALEAEGYSVWWDRALQPGDSFETTIDQEIQAAGCIVVIWSEKSVASQWVKNEALEGLDRKILLPVLLDDVRLPVAFKQHHGVNFKRWPETVDPDEYRRFITAIDGVLNRTQGNAYPKPPTISTPAPRRWHTTDSTHHGYRLSICHLVAEPGRNRC